MCAADEGVGGERRVGIDEAGAGEAWSGEDAPEFESYRCLGILQHRVRNPMQLYL